LIKKHIDPKHKRTNQKVCGESSRHAIHKQCRHKEQI
jgi:hypothetical protein